MGHNAPIGSNFEIKNMQLGLVGTLKNVKGAKRVILSSILQTQIRC